MSKLTLERNQIWLYLCVIFLGGGWGWYSPQMGSYLEPLTDWALGILLYSTFCQVPLIYLRQALRHKRFLIALVVGNFLIIPLTVWLLAFLFLNDPKLELGVFLVLLVPCTDWFLTFAYLGKGNINLAIVSTPILLLLQSLFLPIYLFLFSDQSLGGIINPTDFANVFINLIVLPLSLALLTQQAAKSHILLNRWLDLTSWFPIPLLALVLFLIASSQVSQFSLDVLPSLFPVILIFILHLILAGYISRFLGQLLQLEIPANRTLAFSLGSRNSFVVLPFALALPPEWGIVVTIAVLQPLVELFGLMIYLWWVPNQLLRE